MDTATQTQEEPATPGSSVVTPFRVALVFGAVLIAVLGYLRMRQAADEPLPVYFEIPQFSLTSQSGEAFGRDEMDGKVWVADFVFTDCPAICPLLTAKFKALEEETGAWESGRGARGINFLSVSVDPRNDTPPELLKYATKYGANLDRWTFLTGDPADVAALLQDGFKVATIGTVSEESVANVAKGDIVHVEHFALVDAGGRVRGYYAQDEQSQAKLKRDLRRLLTEPGL